MMLSELMFVRFQDLGKKRGPKKSREIREKSTRREGEAMELFVCLLRPPRYVASVVRVLLHKARIHVAI